MRNKLALSVAISSFIFFSYYIGVLVFMPIGIFGGKDLIVVIMGSRLEVILPVLIVILSLTGSVYAIKELKKISKRWYLAVPYAISLLIICISSSFDLAHGRRTDLFYYLEVLAAITSTGFFLSFPESERTLTRYFAVISGIISIGFIGSFFTLVPDIFHPYLTENYVFILIISMLIAMPIIGVCFIVTAFWVREKVPSVL